MKPPDFDYVAPTSIGGAIKALESDSEARLLAGGQSLIPLLAFRMASPTLLVDLARVEGLDHITDHGDRLVIGAMTRQRRAERDSQVAQRCPLLIEALRHVGHTQIRSQGTIGGSIAHADPAAELPGVVVALGGRVHVAGPAGNRTIEAGDLFQGFFNTAMAECDILTAVELPTSGPRNGWSVVEITRRPGDFALCGALCQLQVGDSGHVVDAHLALIGVGDRPMRAVAVEQAILGGASPAEAAELAPEGLTPVNDVHASSDFRLHLTKVTSRRALTQALERAL
ncbi:FAD binding domain-containing protein [Candidatus Poriferisocius sp.]|uniref:FAD binding domain-containing protein n=1 Tax=Candidatus Poriferisocius sp. TaxID=3101276 RepID=UPI003B5AFD0E